MQPLLAIHDAYYALLEESAPHSRAIAANQLIKNVPIHSANTFKDAFDEMALDVDLSRIEEILVGAFILGRDALSGAFDPATVSELHEQNAHWLASTINRTGCTRESSTARTAQAVSQGSAALPEPDTRATAEGQRSAQASAFFAPLIALIIGIACYAIYQTRHFRIKRIARLPRHAVAFKASAVFNGKNCPIIVLDVSVGGAKIECDHPPVAKEHITLHLPCGTVSASIVWATAFYAGVMFESQLTEKELQTILDDESVTTRSRLSNLY
jgi:hypothetical protein